MDLDELIRQTKIRWVKAEQAIRRSKSLVKGTKRLLGRSGRPVVQPKENVQSAPRPKDSVLEDARRVREKSRKALEQSKAARDHHKAVRDRTRPAGIADEPPADKKTA